MMVEPATIDGLFLNLKDYVSELKRLSSTPRENFLSEPDKVGSAKYHLLVAIESCIDIAHHFVATYRFRRPTDYADAFKVLVEEAILPQELLATLQNMAKFRNLLVHQYAKIDNSRVYEFLQNNLQDFDAFARHVAAQVENLSESSDV